MSQSLNLGRRAFYWSHFRNCCNHNNITNTEKKRKNLRRNLFTQKASPAITAKTIKGGKTEVPWQNISEHGRTSTITSTHTRGHLLHQTLGPWWQASALTTTSPLVTRPTNISFLVTLSKHNQGKRLRELIKWSLQGKCLDLVSNSPRRKS